MQPAAIIDCWHFLPATDTRVAVLPDGCRDLILVRPPFAPPQSFISELAVASEEVACLGGEALCGYRFHPAAVFSEARLLAAVAAANWPDDLAVRAIIDDLVQVDLRLAEALAGLAAADSVLGASRQLGVSPRTLERLVGAATGRPPAFWKSLVRARRAAGVLAAAESLAELAAAQGFADQAHLTREFRRWFGLPPGLLRQRADLLTLIQAVGYD